MRARTLRTVSATLAFAFGATPIWAADSCPAGCPIPPSNSHYVSSLAPAPLPPFPTPMLAASIKKGKKKRVVAVEATVTTSGFAPGAPTSIAIVADVNGTPMEPTAAPLGASVDCGASLLIPPPFTCTVTGSFWLDIDAFPALINVPLTVTLSGGEFLPPVVPPAVATMTVRLQKK